jgi:hypothetical protein
MIKIVLIVKEDCPACSIVKRVITEAINKAETDIVLRTIMSNPVDDDYYMIKKYPTTLFLDKSSMCLARLEGSFPIDYLNKVIDKLKLEYND